MRDIGRISDADYRRLQRRPRRRWPLLACALALAIGGGYASLQKEKRTYNTVRDGMALLNKESPEDWEKVRAVSAFHRRFTEMLEVMEELADDPGEPGLQATGYLGWFAKLSTRAIMRRLERSDVPHRQYLVQPIEEIRKLVQ